MAVPSHGSTTLGNSSYPPVTPYKRLHYEGPKVEIMQVVRVEFTRGCGMTFCTAPEDDHEHGPIRRVLRYVDMQGNLLAEVEP